MPSLARQGLASISTMVLNNAAGVYGDAAIAAMGIANRISMFIFSAALGIGQGFQPVADVLTCLACIPFTVSFFRKISRNAVE